MGLGSDLTYQHIRSSFAHDAKINTQNDRECTRFAISSLILKSDKKQYGGTSGDHLECRDCPGSENKYILIIFDFNTIGIIIHQFRRQVIRRNRN